MSPTLSQPHYEDLPIPAPDPLAIQSSIPPTAPPSPAPPVQPTRRSERHKVPNVRLQDYVCSQVTLPKDAQSESSSSHRTSGTRYPLSNFISYHRYTLANLAFITHLSHSVEPRSFSEANSDPNWQQAMSSELQALESNHTWTLTPLPPGKHPIGCRWVYKIKHNSDGSIEQYKAQLVAKGYTQTKGVDFHDTFSPIAKLVTIRNLLALVAASSWPLHQLDVHNVFLHGNIHEEIYMTPPPGLQRQGENLSKADYSLFTCERGKSFIALLIYVDDILITGNNLGAINSLKRFLHTRFRIKDLGDLKFFLGIEVSRSKKGISISQRKYTIDIPKDSGFLGVRPVLFPKEQNLKLSNTCELLKDPAKYRSTFMHEPRKPHMEVALRILKYLKNTPGQGLFFPAQNDLRLRAYCDSNWGGCPTTRRSTTGCCVFLGNSLISWRSKRQKTVSLSSAEAKYRVMTGTCCELTWLRSLLRDLQLPHWKAMILHCDNQAALHIATNHVFHERTRHIEMDCHFIRDKIQHGSVTTKHVSSSQQVADIFTKALGKDDFARMSRKLGVLDIHSPT
ncbi:unnamed protein product [Prunus armeniaca]